MMVESVFVNSGRGCINCSGIWASRHTREIADAIAQRLAAVRPLPPEHPDAAWRRSRCPASAEAISQSIDADLQAPGVTDVTAKYRDGAARRQARAAPTTCCRPSCTAQSPDAADREEGVHVPVRDGRRVPRGEDARGDRADARLHGDHLQRRTFRRQLLDAVHIDRLNLGPVPTTQLNWLQPHEGNIVEFLFRARAFQSAPTSAERESRRSHGSHEDPVDHRRRRRDVLRQLLPRQRAGRRAAGARPRRHARAGLHADADRRAERQPAPRAVWRHQRLPAAALAALPRTAAVPRSAVGLAARDRRVRGPRRSRPIRGCSAT